MTGHCRCKAACAFQKKKKPERCHPSSQFACAREQPPTPPTPPLLSVNTEGVGPGPGAAWHQTDPCYPLALLTLGIRTCTPKEEDGGGGLFTRSVCVFEFLGDWGRGAVGAPPASSQTQLSRKGALALPHKVILASAEGVGRATNFLKHFHVTCRRTCLNIYLLLLDLNDKQRRQAEELFSFCFQIQSTHRYCCHNT